MDTMKLINWLRKKIENRRSETDDRDPWWVTLMLDVGRPAVAIMILTMCAPGEHYLMEQARFHDPFAWLGPGVLTAYAGIAAVVATKRPKGSPGHVTAVLGAVVAVGLAMAAQPIAHLWGVKGLDLQHILLICVVSSVPSAVFGHLLHMGAAPTSKRKAVHRSGQDSGQKRGQKAGQPTAPVSKVSAPVVSTAAPLSKVSLSKPVRVPTTGQSTVHGQGAGQSAGQSSGQGAGQSTAPAVRRTANGSMRSTARELLSTDKTLSNDDLRTALLSRFGQANPNTLWRSIDRARKDLGIPA